MAISPRSVPRFLPTLTEVVRAPPPQPPVDEGPAETSTDPQAIVQQVRSQVDAVLDRRLHEAIAGAMLEQVDAIAERLRVEIEPLVRQAVADAVAHELGAGRHN